jgi:penicillin-binding protein 2
VTMAPEANELQPEGPAALVPFDAVYTTARFGELRRRNHLPLKWVDGRWQVDWTPAVILPELTAGRTIRAFSDPTERGAILDRHGRPLAVTPAAAAPTEPPAQGALPAATPARQYPQGELAGSLVGYVGEVTGAELQLRTKEGLLPGDRVGKAGVEVAADGWLAGQRGGRLTVLTPRGEIASTLSAIPARPGETVSLTLDLDLQHQAEAALGQRRGSVIVIDVVEGAIRALATFPRYDPGSFVSGQDVSALLNDPAQPLVNRPLQGLYPAGSIFKVVTMAAALERGLVQPDASFTCTGRWTGLPGLTFDCWLRSGHGQLGLLAGLTQSCNSVFYELGKRLDEADASYLPAFAAQCGLASATGALAELEPAGVMPSPRWKQETLKDGWARGDAVNLAIGQGHLLVTPLQVAALYAAIAGGGQRLGPRILDRALVPGGNLERIVPPPSHTPLPWSGATLDAVRSALRDVVGSPTGTAAAAFQGSPLAGTAAGKTGTAETQPGREPHAWFAGYAPLESPRIVVLTMLEHAGEGSQVAAPLARRVLEFALQ